MSVRRENTWAGIFPPLGDSECGTDKCVYVCVFVREGSVYSMWSEVPQG